MFILEYSKQYRKDNKDKINQYQKQRRQTDPVFKLQHCIRSRNNKFLKGKNKSASTQELLGCSAEFLRNYLASQLTSEMTWDNIHIDHYIPLSLANQYSDDKAKFQAVLRILSHYLNLRPLLAADNRSKSDKFPSDAKERFRFIMRYIHTVKNKKQKKETVK